MLFACVAVLALFVLRARQPRPPKSFQTWGYPAAPALFVVVTALIVFNDLWVRPGPALAGLLIIGAGVPTYWLFRRRWV